MADPGADVISGQAVCRQKCVDVVGDVLLDHRRDVLREHQLEPGGAHVVAHGAQRVGVEVTAGVKDVRAARIELFGATVADGHHRRRSISEQCTADQTGQRRFVSRVGHRAEFDGDQGRNGVRRAAQVVVQPRHPRRPGHAAQSEQRHPSHILAQAHPRGDPGVHRRDRETGDRRRDQRVEVLRSQSGLVEGAHQRLAAQVHGFFGEYSVARGEIGQRRIRLHRQDQVTTVDFGAGV